METIPELRAALTPLEALGRLQRFSKGLDVDDPKALRDFAVMALRELSELPEYDVIGMDELVERLRFELKNIDQRTDGIDSVNKLSKRVRVSRSYLSRFRDGDAVCMNIMNRLAEAFSIRYLVENYEDPKKATIE